MILDPDGLFNGDRWRRCSDLARLHAPYLLLASNGFARLEVNYHKIVARAYSAFRETPTKEALMGFIGEYSDAHLLFLYEAEGQPWGVWDTRPELLQRYKTAADRRSPEPPEPQFTQWKKAYRAEAKAFPKLFAGIPKSSRKPSETFLHGVGVGVGGGEGKIPPTPLSEIEPERVGVRFDDADGDEDGIRWYTREEAGGLIRDGVAYLHWQLPEDFDDMALDDLGWKLERINKAITGFGLSPWSDAYNEDAEWTEFAERNGLRQAEVAA